MRVSLLLAAACVVASVHSAAGAFLSTSPITVTSVASTPGTTSGDTRPVGSFGRAFLLGGAYGPFDARVGTTYTFINTAGATHPFAITNNPNTQTPVTGTTAAQDGQTITWTPTTVGAFAYACMTEGHNYMGNVIEVRAAEAASTGTVVVSSTGAPATASSTGAAGTASVAASSTGVAPTPVPAPATSSSTGVAPTPAPAPATTGTSSSTGAAGGGVLPGATTICQTMTAKLNPGQSSTDPTLQYNTMKAFINSVATGQAQGAGLIPATTAPNTGVFNNDLTKKYFNGEFKYRETVANVTVTPSPFASKPTPNFVSATQSNPSADNVRELGLLVDHLASFFGPALGCVAGTGFAPYSNTFNGAAFNQYQVHANMKITQQEFTSFNQQVGASLAAFGVTDTPRVNAAVAVLNSFGRNSAAPNNQICYRADAPNTCTCAPTTIGDACTCPTGQSVLADGKCGVPTCDNGQVLTDGKCTNSAAMPAPSILLAALLLAVAAFIRA